MRIAATGDVDAVTELAELISLCARLRAEDASGDGEAWLAAATRLGRHDDAHAARALGAHALRTR